MGGPNGAALEDLAWRSLRPEKSNANHPTAAKRGRYGRNPKT